MTNHTHPKTTQNTTLSETSDLSSDKKSQLDVQTEQARRMLMRLQWLVIILLASGLVWLYTSFESVVHRVDIRLAKVDAMDGRLNSIDDRLFALTPTDVHQQVSIDEPIKDKELIKVQLALAEQLYEQGRYGDALTALDAISYQLKHTKELATPIKSTLNHKLQADMSHIRALRHQPDTWQAYIIKIRDVQAFLRHKWSGAHVAEDAILRRSDVMPHEINMLLSLAISSANVRDTEQLMTYLKAAKVQLQIYAQYQDNTTNTQSTSQNTQTKSDKSAMGKSSHSLTDGQVQNNNPTTLDEAIDAIDSLITNPPKDRALQSPQVLK